MLHIYNTLTKKKEPFKPISKDKVGLYVCGITAYDYSHLGHARVYVFFDVVTRYLRFLNYSVYFVRNITNIDDKIIDRALKEGTTPAAVVERFVQAFHEDMERLSVQPPDEEPQATDYISEIINLIQDLMNKKYAYIGNNGDIYYDVSQFKEYGQLSHQNLSQLSAGERVAVSAAKHDPLDFVLWKLAKPGEPCWPSPWGMGRPGWHIECSAMSEACLAPYFDIHGGGLDLIFPHHENERAQSEPRLQKKFINYWMHVGFLKINHSKMSKSLKNFFTIRETLEKYHPEVVRYFLLSSHYRHPIHYSEENLAQAQTSLEKLYLAIRSYSEPPSTLTFTQPALIAFQKAMDDDFNTPEALRVLFDLVHTLNGTEIKNEVGSLQAMATLKRLGNLLGILNEKPNVFLQGTSSLTVSIEKLVEARQRAREARDWATADRLRKEIEDLGYLVEDAATGSTWRKR